MALAGTTLSAAVAVGDSVITPASTTGFAAGYIVKIDQELMLIGNAYASGTTPVPVSRGQAGTVAQAHPVTATVTVGISSDWQSNAPQLSVPLPIAGRARTQYSYTASGAIDLPVAGNDALVILNGTSALAMTVAAPGKDLTGSALYIASNGVANHTVTFTGGLSGAGTSYDVITINSSAPVLLGPFMAVNSLWQMAVAVPLAGTVTNITATVA